MRRYSKHTRKEYLNDNAFTSWVKGQTKSATGGVQNALNNIKIPTVEVTIDNKTKYTVIGACTILAIGLIGNALFKR